MLLRELDMDELLSEAFDVQTDRGIDAVMATCQYCPDYYMAFQNRNAYTSGAFSHLAQNHLYHYGMDNLGAFQFHPVLVCDNTKYVVMKPAGGLWVVKCEWCNQTIGGNTPESVGRDGRDHHLKHHSIRLREMLRDTKTKTSIVSATDISDQLSFVRHDAAVFVVRMEHTGPVLEMVGKLCEELTSDVRPQIVGPIGGFGGYHSYAFLPTGVAVGNRELLDRMQEAYAKFVQIFRDVANGGETLGVELCWPTSVTDSRAAVRWMKGQ